MMLKECFKDLNNFGVFVAIVVGILGIGGAIGGWMSLLDWLKNRVPDLHLFVPYTWSGIDAGDQKRYVFIYLRIANSSQKSAYLYLETMSVSLKIKNKWYVTYISNLPAEKDRVETKDFTQSEQQNYGLSKAHFLNRFEDNTVTFDKPLCGYIIVGHANDAIFNDNDIGEIKIEVEDCHHKKHTLCTDFEKQFRSDPHRKYLDILDGTKRDLK